VQAIYRGDARGYDGRRPAVQVVAGRGACAHPDGSARFITSALRLLSAEVHAHLNGGCGRPSGACCP